MSAAKAAGEAAVRQLAAALDAGRPGGERARYGPWLQRAAYNARGTGNSQGAAGGRGLPGDNDGRQMPTPIGHSLAGYIAAKLTRIELTRDERRLFALAAFFGILPDVLSYLLEQVAKEPNHGFSHSLVALALVSLATALWARHRGYRFAPVLLLVAAAYGSHLLTDLLRPEGPGGSGEQLLWPARTAYAVNVDIFPHIPTHQREQLLPWAAVLLSIMLREAMILAPLALLARFIPPLRRGRAPASSPPHADPAASA